MCVTCVGVCAGVCVYVYPVKGEALIHVLSEYGVKSTP